MRYAIISIVFTGLCAGSGVLVPFLISKKKALSKPKKILVGVFTGFILFFVGAGIYFGIRYHSDATAKKALESGNGVAVEEIDHGYYFDGPGEGCALIFYPGAKVEESSYAPLLRMLAENGVDCFLVGMPLNMAIFGTDRADELTENYSYGKWFIAGHSLGGTAASNYAYKNKNKIDGVILLASYSTKDISDMRVLSVYGSNDLCLEKDAYEKNKTNLPSDLTEVVIEGGNHAYFGNYGEQKGDGKADISRETQQHKTVSFILGFIYTTPGNK